MFDALTLEELDTLNRKMWRAFTMSDAIWTDYSSKHQHPLVVEIAHVGDDVSRAHAQRSLWGV